MPHQRLGLWEKDLPRKTNQTPQSQIIIYNVTNFNSKLNLAE
jgi:hypothetical protein